MNSTCVLLTVETWRFFLLSCLNIIIDFSLLKKNIRIKMFLDDKNIKKHITVPLTQAKFMEFTLLRYFSVSLPCVFVTKQNDPEIHRNAGLVLPQN